MPSTAATSYAAADTLNRYPSVAGVSYSYWGTGALNQDGVLARYYDQTGALTYTYKLANTGISTWGPMDALGASVQSEHNAPSGSLSTLVYRSFGPGRPEAVLDRAYSGTNAGQSFPTYVGDRVYVLGPGADERLAYEDVNGTIYYPHVDRQGSTVALSAGGQNVLTRSYSPYGLPNLTVADVGPGPSAYPFLYTGQRYDAVLLAYDYKARIYSPTDGRFWQTDPVGTSADINLYGYTGNSPLTGSDPSGQCPAYICRYGDFPEIEGVSANLFSGEPVSSQSFSVAANVLVLPDAQQQTQTALNTNNSAACSGDVACETAVFKQGADRADEDFKVVGEVGLTGIGVAAGFALEGVAGATKLLDSLTSAKTCCFVAGTLVATETGLRPIETVAIGDRVTSRDPDTGTTALKPVTSLVHRHDREIYVVTLAVQSPLKGEHAATFKTTDDHPWRSVSGEWLHTVELKPGVLLQRAGGEPARVVSVVNSGKTAPTFNLEVADFHTYFVGKDKIWVHNAPCGPRDTRPNSVQNRQASDARQSAERATGQRFNKAQQREFHDRITGNQMSFHELVQEAIDVLTGK